MKAHEMTFPEYLKSLEFDGTHEEMMYLLDEYIWEVEKAYVLSWDIEPRIWRKLENLKKILNQEVVDDILRVDDRAIVKGQNGNPDFEGSFRGWHQGNAIIWIESIGAQLSVEKENVSKKK